MEKRIGYLVDKMMEQDADIKLYKELYQGSLGRIEELKAENRELRTKLSSCADEMEV